jgi:hypothetical protein
MDKPSNKIITLIDSLVYNAWEQNKIWQDAIETLGYESREMEFCNREKEDLKLLDEWIAKVESE